MLERDKKPDRSHMTFENSTMKCGLCGVNHAIPLPAPMSVVIREISLFVSVHKKCALVADRPSANRPYANYVDLSKMKVVKDART